MGSTPLTDRTSRNGATVDKWVAHLVRANAVLTGVLIANMGDAPPELLPGDTDLHPSALLRGEREMHRSVAASEDTRVRHAVLL